jgi:hypothetical protein
MKKFNFKVTPKNSILFEGTGVTDCDANHSICNNTDWDMFECVQYAGKPYCSENRVFAVFASSEYSARDHLVDYLNL